MSFKPTPHPVLSLPTAAESVAMGAAKFHEAMARREQVIAQEKASPFENWYEPPIWKVCDALLGFPWVEPVWADRMRRHLGFEKPVRILLINGGQRGGKSQYAGNRSMRLLSLKKGCRAWALHSTLQMSRDYQQPIFWNYLPAHLRAKDLKTRVAYIAYKQKTGFSEEKFVLPSGSDCLFKAYEQDRRGIEGGNLDIIWPDELVPSDWVETMELRIAEKNGCMIITFTPVDGYTETVRMFQDGAEVVKESTAYLCPTDGGPPDEARALGLTPEELAEVKAAEEQKRAACYPQCRPEDCNQWIDGLMDEGMNGQAGQQSNNPLIQQSTREFERVPRVMKCVDAEGKRAVVFFHSSDNPYGNPKSVWSTIASKPRAFIKERFYGVATKTLSARFPRFDLKVHVVDPAVIPADGTNYLVVDPCGGRNFFMTWFRVTPEHVYIYREWPGPYYIEGVGLPGPWALPDGKRPDGRMGPAQTTFGWGNRDYKKQIALLEGWKDAKKGKPGNVGEKEWIDGWDEANGAVEAIQERFMDSRFASVPKMENDRPVTLLTNFEELLLFFSPTPGDDISEGVQEINDALNYDKEKPVDFFNKPKLLISRDCPNTIFSFQTWTGRDGNKGATKDPVDTVRYFFLADCAYLGGKVEEEQQETEDDGNYY